MVELHKYQVVCIYGHGFVPILTVYNPIRQEMDRTKKVS